MSLSNEFVKEFKKYFAEDIRLDPASKVLYSTDASIYQIQPLGVVIPKSQDGLQAVVELAAKYDLPILPRGSGSSLAGQAVGEALILDCSRYLDSILEINPEERYAIVESGVILSDLNRAASKYGLMFGPDPASAERATMGGVIGNNATGAHSILYGMSADHLLEADVILSDGSLAKLANSKFDIQYSNARLSNIVSAVQMIREKYTESIKQNYPKSWRNSAGYRLNYLLPFSQTKPPQWKSEYPGLRADTCNLAPLLAGSEGTLAVIQRMKVNLVHKPKHTMLGVLSYNSVEDACDDVPRLLQMNPSAVELIPRLILEQAHSIPAYARQMGWVIGNPAAVLVVEFSGDSLSALKDAVRRLGDVLTIAETAEEQSRIWNIRKVGLGILDSRPQSARPIAFIEDCAIPVERLGEFVREVEKILSSHNTYGGIYAHASGGCLHIRPVLNLQNAEDLRALRTISEQVFLLTMSLGGAMSSEHGDGLARGEFIERTYGKEVTEAMRLLKRAADPKNILNPKKMFDAPPMDTNLRYSETYHAKAWASALHFEHERGLPGAIEMCNGQGVCRKNHGVMCPSFQASREEGLSTRGRANLLRAVISGQQTVDDGRSMVNDLQSEIEEATFKTLDLCLACKGCTSECPSGVDMPKLKYEFMNQYYKSHRRPLHDYLFAYFHVVAKWMSPIAPLPNLFMKMSWSRKIISKVFGIAEQRSLPLFAKREIIGRRVAKGREKKVVLFLSDVFSEYIEPEVKAAAFDILHELNYEVRELSLIGAGASFLSKGFIDQAQRHAGKILDEIKTLSAGADVSVVGCEPPEIYCLKHEYIGLFPERRQEIESITKEVWMVDEFILRVANQVELFDLKKNRNEGSRFFLHPHCHQRAEGPAADGFPTGVSATVALLNQVGFDVEVIDSGCCGMAGTFGYDAEHYDLSMKVGELSVLPKIRESASEKWISTGAACRMQIQHGAGVEAKHPLVLIRDAIRNGQK